MDIVEALMDSIADTLNQHEQEIPEPQKENIVLILDKQLVDTCDAHLENTLEFDYEYVDSDTEERINAPDLLPLDPKKEERLRRMKMSSGFFIRKTKWERYTRVSVPYLEESKKEIFPIGSDH